MEYNLSATWKSMTYPNIAGIHALTIVKTDEEFNIKCIVKYDNDSSFRPGVSKIYELRAVRRNDKIIAQTHIDSDCQLNIIFALDKPSVSGFYSMLTPVDCGTIKIIETKSRWCQVFDAGKND